MKITALRITSYFNVYLDLGFELYGVLLLLNTSTVLSALPDTFINAINGGYLPI